VRIEGVARFAGERPTGLGVELTLRTVSAVVLAAFGLGAAYLGGVAAGVAAGLVSAVVHLEWSQLTEESATLRLPFTAAILVAIVIAGTGQIAIGLAVACIALVLGAAISRNLWLPGGIAYAAILGLSLIALRLSPDFGLTAILFVFAIVWATDTGAYFTGRLVGGPLLWPAVSPKKTIAGSAGGIVAALVAGVVVARLAEVPVTGALVAVSLILSAACQLGDLFESAVKRRFNAKDASTLLPGHGGFMDRVDGLAFAGALAALIGWTHGGGPNLAGGLLLW